MENVTHSDLPAMGNGSVACPANHTTPAAAAAARPTTPVPEANGFLLASADKAAVMLGVDVYVVLVAATTLTALLLYRLVFHRVLVAAGIMDGGGAGGGRRGGSRRRHTALMVGLPSSGKTRLLQQLLAYDEITGAVSAVVAETRTSMQPNTESILGGRLAVVDYPGHRRLRAGLFPHLREAATLLVVIDSITIHDDRHEGAYAVAELLLSVLPSAEFHGVKSLLFVCAKRDDLTAYSAKAVRKLLEKAMSASLRSQQGDLARVDTVVDSKGAVIGGVRGKGGWPSAGGNSKGLILDLDDDGVFDFDEQLNIPVEFVEVGCAVAGGDGTTTGVNKKFSVQSVVEFLSSS